MARRKQQLSDPNQVVHLQVKPGATVIYDGRAYGDRGTLQVPRYSAEGLLKAGRVHEVNPAEVPDAGSIPEAA